MDIKNTKLYEIFSETRKQRDILSKKYRNKEISAEEYNKLCDAEWDKFYKYPDYSEEDQRIDIFEVIRIYNEEEEKAAK